MSHLTAISRNFWQIAHRCGLDLPDLNDDPRDTKPEDAFEALRSTPTHKLGRPAAAGIGHDEIRAEPAAGRASSSFLLAGPGLFVATAALDALGSSSYDKN